MKGFTLVEIIVVMAIMALLLSLVTLDVWNSARRASVDSATNLLIADLKQQQIKAMTGEGVSASTSGISFAIASYTLLPENFTVSLDKNLQFSNPSTSVIFLPGSGQVQNFQSQNNSITITNTTSGTQKTLQFNQFGVVTSINQGL